MKHISEQDLLQMDQLTPQRLQEIEAHLATCAPCRSMWEAQRDLWSLMGTWKTPHPPDLSQIICMRLAKGRPAQRRWRPAFRVAAAVAISTGVGYLGGHLARPSQAAPTPGVQDVASVLHLNDASGLASLEELFAPPPPTKSTEEVPG